MKSEKQRRAAFFKVILAAALTAATGLGMLYIYQVAPTFNWVRYAWLAALGLAAGLFSRIVMDKHTGALRFTSALFSVVAGLWAADWITRGYLGFEILYFDLSTTDYPNLIETGIGWLTVILALRAWKRKPVQQEIPVEPAPEPAPTPAPRPASTQVFPLHTTLAGAAEKTQRNFRAAIRSFFSRITSWPSRVFNRPVNLNLGGRVVSQLAGHHMVIPAPQPRQPVVVSAPPPKAVAPKKIRKRKKNKNQDDNVKLVGAEDHRCPFCLEDIDMNDPRGVKICPICKTYHHADCWDVTGMCQIPHHQEL